MFSSLAFAELDDQEQSVEKPNNDTCEWIFDSHEYQKWSDRAKDSTSRVPLWIKGKPGSGKSTLLKKIWLTHKKSSSAARDNICIAFFFSARGKLMEHSSLGMYRGLLLHLILRCELALGNLLELFQLREQTRGSGFAWQVTELSNLFHEELARPRKGSLEVFIDALDECNETEIRSFVQRLEKSCMSASRAGTDLKVCMTSRHYPTVTMRRCHEVFMESANSGDIANYVQQELVLSDEDLMNSLKQNIMSCASNTFLWVKIVCARILLARDRGVGDEEILEIVNKLEIGDDLTALFEEIVGGLPDLKKGRLFGAAHINHHSNRTISAMELSVALQMIPQFSKLDKYSQRAKELERASQLDCGNDVRNMRTIDAMKRMKISFNEDRFKKQVTDFSGGLLEVIGASKNTPHTIGRSRVQVVHETVREYLAQLHNDEHSDTRPNHEFDLISHIELSYLQARILSLFKPHGIRYAGVRPELEAFHELLMSGLSERVEVDRDLPLIEKSLESFPKHVSALAEMENMNGIVMASSSVLRDEHKLTSLFASGLFGFLALWVRGDADDFLDGHLMIVRSVKIKVSRPSYPNMKY